MMNQIAEASPQFKARIAGVFYLVTFVGGMVAWILGRRLGVYFYAANTLTPQNVYKDTGLTLTHPNPMTLEASARVPEFYCADGSIRARRGVPRELHSRVNHAVSQNPGNFIDVARSPGDIGYVPSVEQE